MAPARKTAVGLLGAPLAAGSVTSGACDLAPELLRRTLKRIGRYDVETGRESRRKSRTAATWISPASVSRTPRRVSARPS